VVSWVPSSLTDGETKAKKSSQNEDIAEKD